MTLPITRIYYVESDVDDDDRQDKNWCTDHPRRTMVDDRTRITRTVEIVRHQAVDGRPSREPIDVHGNRKYDM